MTSSPPPARPGPCTPAGPFDHPPTHRTHLKGAPRRLHRDTFTPGQWQAQQGLTYLLQVIDALEHRGPHTPALLPTPAPLLGEGFTCSAPSPEERRVYDLVRAHVQARQLYTPRMQALDAAAIHGAPAAPQYSFDGRGIHLAAQDLAVTLDRYFHPVMWPECATSTTWELLRLVLPALHHALPWRDARRHGRWLPTAAAERAAETLAARQALTPLRRRYAVPAADQQRFDEALTRLELGLEPLPWPPRRPVTP